MLIRVRFESLDGEDHDLEIAYDPQLYNDGSDDVGWTRGHALLAHDRHIASALVARPSLTRTSSGYVGRDRAPARAHLRRPAARQRRPAGAHAADRPRRAARPDARARLRAARDRRRSRPRRRRSIRGFDAISRRLRARAGPTTARRCCRSRPRRCRSPPPTTRRCSCSRPTRTRTTRGAFVASPSDAVGLGRADDRRGQPALGPVSPRLVARPLPDRDRAARGRRQRRPPTARSTSCSITSSSTTARSRRTPRSTGGRSGRALQMDQVGLPIVLAWQLGRTSRSRLAATSAAPPT